MKTALARRADTLRGALVHGLSGRAALILLDEHSATAIDAEFPLPHALPSSQDRATAAGVTPLHTSAAFSLPCPDVGGQAATAPANTPKSPALAGAVSLSDASAFILTLIAAHHGRSPADVLAQLLAAAGEAIGLSPLLESGARDSGCLADLPGYARAAANRFRGGGP